MDVADWNGDGRLDLIMGEPRNYLGGGNMTIAINVGTNEDPVFEYDLYDGARRLLCGMDRFRRP